MNETNSWPEGLAVGATRIGRRCNRYEECVIFYRDVVGLPLLYAAETGPDDFGCAIFGLPGASTTFELVEGLEPVPVDRHEELVLYFSGKAARDVVARRITEAGYEPAQQYRYWDLNDAVTYLDPDGRELVLAPWVFGEEPPPMRARGGTPPTG
ncbi:VOC family protein [Streptomyces albidus (ex Kaewkla and Franco 2022)]|uniref:VOC family protein n=1 Tax=Streptomyces albidus (ex Kaewkla and Franco 2022) TaxID=722709 RepID=UPI001B3548A1|nr:VOC family protein [Streptomyces albidus (ex Kaewkla and Franco 2022)]